MFVGEAFWMDLEVCHADTVDGWGAGSRLDAGFDEVNWIWNGIQMVGADIASKYRLSPSFSTKPSGSALSLEDNLT